MQTQSRFFDDIAQLLTSAMGAAQGVRQEAEQMLRYRLERLLAQYEIVSREEFEAIREMCIRAREENEALSDRLDGLETALVGLTDSVDEMARDIAAAAAGQAQTLPSRGGFADAMSRRRTSLENRPKGGRGRGRIRRKRY